MDISLDRVLEAARERRATLTPEVAGYVILLAAQQLAAEQSQVSAQSVLLDETGDVLVERGAAANEHDIEAVLRELLRALIAVCSSPPPAIVAVAERGASGDLRGLVAELRAALIPINHSAAHRALARLFREARRADGHATDTSLPPIVERGAQPTPVAAPAAESGELDIDVMIEPEAAAAAPDPAPRDLLAPDLPTRDPGVGQRDAAEPVISHVDGEAEPGATDDELRLLLPATPRWTEARSDVQQLLDAFLAETRAVEPMLRALREMIGLDRSSHRDVSLAEGRSRRLEQAVPDR